MIIITQEEWDKIPNDYKGQWTKENAQFRTDVPKEFIGKRTVMSGRISEKAGELLTDDVHFKIV